MANPLLTGVSGLTSHQKMLEVIGNNLANLNSTAYKAQRVLFSDLLYSTVTAATSGTNGTLGGINPSQVGSGSSVSIIDSNLNQGNLSPTGQTLDFAIDGDGFFVVSGGGAPRFTRAGSFRVDSSGLLVDPSTGYLVQRYGDAGEPDGLNPAFQVPGDQNIHIPFGAGIPGRATSEMDFKGNLSSQSLGPAERVISSNAPWLAGGSPATAATLLSNIDGAIGTYAPGDSILITGTDVDGTPVNTSLSVDATTTLGDLVAAINAAFPQADAALDSNGNVVLTAGAPGASFLSLNMRDANLNVGGLRFDQHPMVVIEQGRTAATIVTGFDVYDVRGQPHNIRAVLEKQEDGSWTLTASMDEAAGIVIDGRVENIRFNDDGSFREAGGVGIADVNLSFQFTGLTEQQTIRLSFGTSGSYDGLTQLASSSAVSSEQDGFSAGTLVDVQLNSDGTLLGIATNGRSIVLGQLALASFRNPSGLNRVGNNYYEVSLASGDAKIGTALSGDRGSVRSNHLETSNVDIALEFTQLIIAQRGFSANARTITVTDEVLKELTQLIR
ncbi:MAG: flagellar hook-basal body complex protein [Planctomyces sp.]|nr:flagellar hook-basal body complex protein [Planctomyces sp.]